MRVLYSQCPCSAWWQVTRYNNTVRHERGHFNHIRRPGLPTPQGSDILEFSGNRGLSAFNVTSDSLEKLLKFLQEQCMSLMDRFKYKLNRQDLQDTHWTVGTDTNVAYQTKIAAGGFGNVYQGDCPQLYTIIKFDRCSTGIRKWFYSTLI